MPAVPFIFEIHITTITTEQARFYRGEMHVKVGFLKMIVIIKVIAKYKNEGANPCYTGHRNTLRGKCED